MVRLDMQVVPNGKSKTVTQCITCNTENIIYVINCNKCCKSYIGSTINNIKKRFSSHLSSIKNNNETNCHTLVQHFQNKECLNSLSFNVIEKVKVTTIYNLRKREDFYIGLFNTTTPNGLNDKNSCKKSSLKIPQGLKLKVPNARFVNCGFRSASRIFHYKKFV